jgi:cohesin loading factor subunit SCC2
VDEEEWPKLADVEDLDVKALSLSNVMYACYSIFAYYLQQADVDTKCVALRALSGIFMSRPRVMLMLEQDGTIGEIMSQESPADLQLESLRCWRDLLLVEENRVESGDAKARMEARTGVTVSKRISGDQDGDATLIGGVLTQHAPRLFQMTTSHDHRIRLAAVDLLGHLLRQGLLNPMETVPYLFALQGDVQAPSVRELALKLLIVEGEKRPDMLRQRVCDGVKQAYLLQRTVYSTKLDVTAVVRRKRGKSVEVECIFGSVFKDCIRSSKKQRQGLYRNLLGLFTSDDTSDELMGRLATSVGSTMDQELPLLSFAAQMLAHLPYNTASDPLFIIYHVSSTVAIQGAQLLDRLSSFLRNYGLSGSDEFDDHNTNEDALEKAAKGEVPSRKKEAALVNKASFDVERFAKLCGEASAIVLLLRLKLFLRKVYNLSETRCLEYSPDAKERICDKGVSAPADMPVFNGRLEMRAIKGTKAPRKMFDKDALIRQYAEFRRLMRAEHGSDARMSDSDDSPTSRKRKGSDASTPAN